MDVYELLMQDHQKAKHLVEKLAETSEGAKKSMTRHVVLCHKGSELEEAVDLISRQQILTPRRR